MKLLILPVAVLAMCVGAAPAWAVPGSPDSHETAPSSADPVDELLRTYDADLFNGRYQEALAVADKFQPNNSDGEAFAAALKASALLGLKRGDEARDLIAKAERLAPSSPDASRVVFIGALLANQPDFAADALDRMIARAPDMVRELDWDMVSFFLRNEPKNQETKNEDRRIALARIGYGGDNEVGHYRANDAIEILVKRGDYKSAADLLPYAGEPEAVENMLIQKRFSPLWPRLQELAGTHLNNIRTSSVRSAERDYAAAPDDHDKLQLYVNALRHAGRLDSAIALRSKLPATIGEMSSVDEQMGWAVNNVALALHEAGRADEADQLFAMLNDAPMPKEYWRVSMKINRLELLVKDGKYEKAWPLIEPTAKTEGSPYAVQLVRRLKYCTLSGLGRKDEAASYLPELLKHAEDAPGPTIDGLLCAGEYDEAEKVALNLVKSKETFAEDFVRQLQVHLLTSDDPSVWQGRWQKLRARPAIAAEFDRLGRDMPEQLLAPTSAVASR
jgi:tetratricopeptide (TPR) repeat protein